MNPQPQRALLTILVHAAMADGQKADSERQFIRELAQQLDAEAGAAQLSQALQDALLKRVTLAQAVAQLEDAEQRQLAYEWALAVCDADGVASTAEQAFLSQLRAQLGFTGTAVAQELEQLERQTHSVAAAAYADDFLDADERTPEVAPAAQGWAAAPKAAMAMAGVGGMGREENPPEDFKEYYKGWLKILEGHYMTLFQSAEYARTLVHSLTALQDFTVAKDALMAEAMEALSLPSRRDLDDLYREMYVLKKSLKEMAKKLDRAELSQEPC